MKQIIQTNPLISIITVCFNSEKTIRRTIESVLNQIYSNIEYILVDGKSTDRTVAIIEEYVPLFAERGIKYHWISEPDRGIYDAMNKGINIASGEWVGIINSDDAYELDACRNIAEASSHGCVDVIHGNVRYLANISGELYFEIQKPDISRIYQGMFIFHPTVFIRKALYDIRSFDDSFKIAADWDLICYFHQNRFKFLQLDKIITNFYHGGVSSEHNYILAMECSIVSRRYNKLPRKIYYGYHIWWCYMKSKIRKLLRIKSRRFINMQKFV